MSEPTGPAGGDLAGEYPNPTIAPGAVDEDDYAALSIPTGALQNLSVTAGKLAEAVSNLLLGAGRVVNEYLANEAVGESKIAAKAVSLAKLAAAVVARLIPEGGVEGQVVKKGAGGPEWGNVEPSPIEWKALEGVNAKLVNISCRVGVLAGVIFLAGVLEVKEELIANSLMFTLPAGARPEKEMLIQISGGSGTALRSVTVKVNGEVLCGALKPTSSPVSFSCSFPLK